MTMPQKFPQPPSSAIASYNYTDISSKEGYIIFYGALHQELTVSKGYLSKDKGYSNGVVSYGTATTTSFTKEVDEDYDVLFNGLQRLKGKIRVTLTLGTGCETTDNASETYAIIKAIHIDSASAETSLGTATTETMVKTTQAAETAFSETKNVEIDVAAEQLFREGETLRITVEIWGRKTGTNSCIHGFGHDPMDRNDEPANPDFNLIEDTDTTIFAVHVPFVLTDI